MATTGTATIDFGAFPGKTDTSLAITGQAAIVAGSYVEAWIRPTATSDHTVDEHIVDAPRVVAGNISAGVGFTIYAVDNANHGNRGEMYCKRTCGTTPRPYGQWTVAWVWN
jgi:hypothetical protein